MSIKLTFKTKNAANQSVAVAAVWLNQKQLEYLESLAEKTPAKYAAEPKQILKFSQNLMDNLTQSLSQEIPCSMKVEFIPDEEETQDIEVPELSWEDYQ